MQTAVRRLEQAWQKEVMQIMSPAGLRTHNEEPGATNDLFVARSLKWLAECSTVTGLGFALRPGRIAKFQGSCYGGTFVVFFV